jgi:TRAP transporter TAXI family solute receptor
MNKDLRRLKQSLVDAASTWGLAVVLIVIGFVFTYQFVGPAPPERIVMATGQEGGAYRSYGDQFVAYLAAEGIEIELLATAGSVENLQLLNSGSGVDIGFVQGGLNEALPTDNVVAAASLYWEPLWLFARADVRINAMPDLAGKRIAVGQPGSGTRGVALNMLAANGIDAGTADLLELASEELADGFTNNTLDAAFLIGAPESATVARLVSQPGVKLHSLARAPAYVRRYPYFSSITLPEGVLDLQANIPPADVNTVAVTAMLAANKDLHPALFDLLLIAATDIFGQPGLLVDAGQFPTSRYIDLPLSESAERYFRRGPPFLMQYLPFWAATLVDRLWIMLLPLIGLVIPLVKLVPPAYRWRIRKRLLNMYAELEAIDPLVHPVEDAADLTTRKQRLDRLDADSAIGTVPKSYTDDIYKLRRDIDLVRRRLLVSDTKI